MYPREEHIVPSLSSLTIALSLQSRCSYHNRLWALWPSSLRINKSSHMCTHYTIITYKPKAPKP